jgi:dihydroxyacetone kinase
VTPEVESWVFREFRVRETRVFQLVEELEDVEVEGDGGHCPEFVGYVGKRKLRVVELVQIFEPVVATKPRAENFAKTGGDIVAEGYRKNMKMRACKTSETH